MAVRAKLSDGERRFLIDGASEDYRSDGRRCWDRRELDMDIDKLPTCAGSSQLRCGQNHVLVGVKADLVDLNPGQPDRGSIQFFAHLSGLYSENESDIVEEVISIFDTSYKDSKLLNCLVALEGQVVWSLFVDILILEAESKASLYDLCSFAVKAALSATKLPKVYYNQGKEIELSDQPSDMISLDTHDVPIFVTVTRVGNNYLLDPTEEEEAASVSSVTVSFNDQSEILHTKKIGSGSLHTDPIKDLLPKLSKTSKDLHAEIERRCRELLSRPPETFVPIPEEEAAI
ncbi:exosome complex component Rrp42 [Brevipalpus obovatus]|uniref:exosome complex component Rrp42 n=1 Tax=Brevipalpus obovatus TaxID=246614 RepID=UPI003D9EEC63